MANNTTHSPFYLSEGTFGAVLKCWSEETSTFFAIKIFREERFFSQELQITRELKHDNIVRFLRSGATPNTEKLHKYGEFCIHYEFIDGKPFESLCFDAVCAEEFIPNMRALRNLAEGGIQALDFIHNERNLAHCDIKPANMMVTKTKLTIIDFGLARENPGPLDHVVGTVDRTPPEFWMSGTYDAKSGDIYAFGTCFLQLITGSWPTKLNKTLLGLANELAEELPHARFETICQTLKAGIIEILSLHHPNICPVKGSLGFAIDYNFLGLVAQLCTINPADRYCIDQDLQHHQKVLQQKDEMIALKEGQRVLLQQKYEDGKKQYTNCVDAYRRKKGEFETEQNAHADTKKALDTKNAELLVSQTELHDAVKERDNISQRAAELSERLVVEQQQTYNQTQFQAYEDSRLRARVDELEKQLGDLKKNLEFKTMESACSGALLKLAENKLQCAENKLQNAETHISQLDFQMNATVWNPSVWHAAESNAVAQLNVVTHSSAVELSNAVEPSNAVEQSNAVEYSNINPTPTTSSNVAAGAVANAPSTGAAANAPEPNTSEFDTGAEYGFIIESDDDVQLIGQTDTVRKRQKLQAAVAVVDEDTKMGDEIHDAVREATAEFTVVPVEFWHTMDWAIDMTNNSKSLVSFPRFVHTARSTKNFGIWLQVALCAIKSHVKKCRITWMLATGRSEDAYKSTLKRSNQQKQFLL